MKEKTNRKKINLDPDPDSVQNEFRRLNKQQSTEKSDVLSVKSSLCVHLSVNNRWNVFNKPAVFTLSDCTAPTVL